MNDPCRDVRARAPNARRLLNEILALPSQDDLTPADRDQVFNRVTGLYAA